MMQSFIPLALLLALAPPSTPTVSPAKAVQKKPPAFPTTPLRREAPTVTMPVEIVAEVGVFVTISPVTTGKNVVFHAIDPGLSVFPPNLLSNPKVTVVVAQRAGRFRVLAYTAAGDVPSLPAMTTIVVGNAPPVPVPAPVDPVVPVGPVRPAGFAGECFDQMKAFPKAEVQTMQGILSMQLGDPNLRANLIKNVIATMNAKNLPGERWTPFVAWLRGRLSAIYEADGTTATQGEVEQGIGEWMKGAEALLK
jgi:hypothetical protein